MAHDHRYGSLFVCPLPLEAERIASMARAFVMLDKPRGRPSARPLVDGGLLMVNQRLRELLCVILGHNWWYSDLEPHGSPPFPRWRGEVGAYRFCERCHRTELNL